MKKIFIFFTIILIACSSLTPQTTTNSTHPTPTQIPLDKLTINSSSIREILSITLTTGLFSKSTPSIFPLNNIPPSINPFHFEIILTYGEERVGWVSIIIYADPDQTLSAYQTIINNLSSSNPNPGNVGEQSTLYKDGRFGGIAFIRCTTVVHITLRNAIAEAQDFQDYAHDLDQYLTPLICIDTD